MLHKPLLVLLCVCLSGCVQVHLFGPVAGSSVAVTRLDNGASITNGESWDADLVIAANGQERWEEYGEFGQLALMGIYIADTEDWDDDSHYLITATGGADTDPDRDRLNNSDATAVFGSWRAIVTGAQAKRRDAKITPLTEAIYQYIRPSLDNMPASDLNRQLDLLAQLLVDDVNNDGEVDYNDALRWSGLFNPGTLRADESQLYAIATAITNGDSSDAILTTMARDLVQSGGEISGELVYRDTRPNGNSFTCATCHAVVEPAVNGFARPGHPLADALRRPTYKDGQTSSLLVAVNSCLDEWMNADQWTESSAEYVALRTWLDRLAPAGETQPVDIQITAIPADMRGGDATAGRTKFNSSCAGCHAQDGTGSNQAPAIAGFAYDENFVATRVRSSGRSDSPIYQGLTGGIMPFWGANRLTDTELIDIAAFLALGSDEVAEVIGSGGGSGGAGNSGCGNDHAMVGYSLNFTTRHHSVAGTATILDNCTIELTNFTYDGRGIVVQVYTGVNGNFRGRGNFGLSGNLVGPAFNNATLRYTLPTGKSLDDFNSLSIWCIDVGVSFGDGTFRSP